MGAIDRQIKETFFSSCIVDKDNLYFFSDGTFKPIKYNLNTNIAEYLVADDHLSDFQNGNPEKVFLYEDYIFVVKNTGDEIIRISLKDRSTDIVQIGASYLQTDNFALITLFKNTILCFCRTISKVIIMDCESLEVKEQELISVSEGGYKIGSVYEDYVYLFPKSGDAFLLYDLDKKTYRQKHLGENLDCVSNIAVANMYLYILERSGKLSAFNRNSYELIKSVKVGKKAEYGFIATCSRGLVLLPSIGEDIKIVDSLLDTFYVYSEYPSDFFYKEVSGKSKFFFPTEDDNYFYFAKRLANYILEVDKDNGELIWIKIDAAVSELFIASELKKKNYIYENKANKHLKEYLSVIKKGLI